MKLFATDLERLDFLLEADAAMYVEPDDLEAEAAAEEKRPKYITNYIGSKQKLIDWIWKNTPDVHFRAFPFGAVGK